jgi:hypothetical protein
MTTNSSEIGKVSGHAVREPHGSTTPVRFAIEKLTVQNVQNDGVVIEIKSATIRTTCIQIVELTVLENTTKCNDWIVKAVSSIRINYALR